ncbi:MAG: bifunctional (p)ppGpp synthetase/guanosine-3',5'-bis(diphosphate) 3'-pyrophosphohydrolase [Oscillospiraceae bacterium]|nr:bifunctional (p)ppGpp synthetase/guanosine-3',5'-bis(diphosphate) 3'-pyrophosphohydrolase [Oscillospiraceae bacterium]
MNEREKNCNVCRGKVNGCAVCMERFLDKVRKVGGHYDIHKISMAFKLACEAHEGQFRKSGEPYVCHPISVAEILIDFFMDTDTIVAALLHDVVEDTELTREDLQSQFGKTVAMLVDGVTKVSNVKLTLPGTDSGAQILTMTEEEQKSENIRKILVSMCEDPRVIIIKLADRMHNMRTLDAFRREKQIRIALETVEFYAPIAHRMGIAKMKDELEDISLFYYDRFAYDDIVESIEDYKSRSKVSIETITERIRDRLSDMNPPPVIEGRIKGVHSLYRKCYLQGKDLKQIYDVYAVRIIAATKADCYTIMGVVHDMYNPLNRFKDYIASPKTNGYQSLHTTLLSNEKQAFEVQIRTQDMHNTARFGIAAHWRYKLGESLSPDDVSDNKFLQIRQLLDLQHREDGIDLLAESIKTDLSPDEVHVFTPKGEPRSLPLGSTVVDFAYGIHSQVGNTMKRATVDGKEVRYSHVLCMGDVIEIHTDNDAPGPDRSWLGYAKTNGAKSKIQSWLKRHRSEENIASGRAFVESILRRDGYQFDDKLNVALTALAFKNRFNTLEDFYAAIGYGGVSTANASRWIKEELHNVAPVEVFINNDSEQKKPFTGASVLSYEHAETPLKLANCCSPLPGDEIVGFVTRNDGISIHKKDCYNIEVRAKLENNGDDEKSRVVEAAWTQTNEDVYNATIEVIAHDRKGLLADVVLCVANNQLMILSSNSRMMKNGNASISFTVEVTGVEQLRILMSKLNQIDGIVNVERGVNV